MKRIRPEYVLVLLIAVGFVAGCILLDVLGKSGRSGITPSFQDNRTIYLARSTSDLYHFWRHKGIKGMVMVHAGRYLHYEAPPNPSDYAVTDGYPLVVTPLRHEHENNIGYRNFLWNALHVQVARKLYYLLPPEAFQERFADGAGEAEKTGDGGMRTHDLGKQRIIGTSFPAVTEPVVLNMDASFLASLSGAAILGGLSDRAAPLGLVSVCLAEDNPDVTSVERARTLELLNSAPLAAAGIRIVEIPSAGKGEQ